MEPATSTPLDGSLERPFSPPDLPEGACCAWHPQARATFVCGRCGNYGCPHCVYGEQEEGRTVCTTCGPREAIPWERRRELGWWKAFWQTTKQASRTPTAFFRAQQLEAGSVAPIGYGALAYTVGQLFWGIQITVLLSVGMAIALAVAPSGNSGGPSGAALGLIGLAVGLLYGVFIMAMTLFQAPVAALFGIMLSGGLTHLSLYLMKRTTAGFESTLRAMSYANAAHVYLGIPIVGPFVAMVWVPVVEIIGVRETHKCGTGAATFAVLAYRFVIIGGILSMYALLVGAMFYAGAANR